MIMEFISSQKGRNKLICNGYMYVFERFGTQEKTIWKCYQYYKTKCKGRIHTKNDQILKQLQHNHAPDLQSIEAAKGAGNSSTSTSVS